MTFPVSLEGDKTLEYKEGEGLSPQITALPPKPKENHKQSKKKNNNNKKNKKRRRKTPTNQPNKTKQ